MNKSWTDRWRRREALAFGTARPVSETRRFKPEGEEEQGDGREGGRRLHPKICEPTGNTRTLLVTSRWMLQAYTGPPCRQRACISYDTKTSHYFPLSLDHSAQPLPAPSYSSPPRNARGHVTTIMPVLLLLSRSLPCSSSRPPPQPPSFLRLVHFSSHC